MNDSFRVRLATACLSLLSVLACRAGETVGVPWRGEPGITETVQQIMAREAAAPRSEPQRRVKPLRKPGHPPASPAQAAQSSAASAAARAVVQPRLAQTLATSFLGE